MGEDRRDQASVEVYIHPRSAVPTAHGPTLVPVLVGVVIPRVVPFLGRASTAAPVATLSRLTLQPNPGPQAAFLACKADIAIYGGAAGGGKTRALLYDCGRWACNAKVKGFTGVIFRRTFPQITNPGALWDESSQVFPLVGGRENKGQMRWDWPKTRSWIKFSHMQLEKNVQDWKGAQLAFVGFDELTEFTERQFFYMLSRMRSMCGVDPYLRGTTNPEPGSWVEKLIEWWIDQKTGFPIPERSGVVRYFVREGDRMVWADTKGELIAKGYETEYSFTFIPAKVTDNRPLLDANSTYIAALKSMTAYDRAILLDGNWKVKMQRGMIFRIEKIKIVTVMPTDVVQWVRYWDRAGTEPSETNKDPDWTSGTLMGKRANGRYIIADVRRVRLRPMGVTDTIKQCAMTDQQFGADLWLEQDPGSAGVAEISNLYTELAGHPIHVNRVTTKKVTRAKPFASQVEAGNVEMLQGPWNAEVLSTYDAFVDEDLVDRVAQGYHDDDVDSGSGAFNALHGYAEPAIY